MFIHGYMCYINYGIINYYSENPLVHCLPYNFSPHAGHVTVYLCVRRQQSDYVSLSFDTISGVGPNGAIIHYR